MKELTLNEMNMVSGGACDLEEFAHAVVGSAFSGAASGAIAGIFAGGAGTISGAITGGISSAVSSGVGYLATCWWS